ncbi:hypothetical protein [Micrococcus sp. TA1]|uniref:hypothetical protein n=1 Tax=Micrococcus sp. TA1 TaxID=681627 RepID=UPI001622E30B|nr:hypothetical protein [Micrococcus sp. TA1]MBB5748557.1 hypothetical protein [Micrococcus sp. TA1]
MNIPEEAIEKAAEELHFWRGHVVPWENMHDAAKDGWRGEARAALSAAAPLIAAQAWDEGRRAGNQPVSQPNPYKEQS